MGKTLDKILRDSVAAAALGFASLAGTARAEPYNPVLFAQQQKQDAKQQEPTVTDAQKEKILQAYKATDEYKRKNPAFFDELYKAATDPKNDTIQRWVLLNFAKEYAEKTCAVVNVDGAFKVIDYRHELFTGMRPTAEKCSVLEAARKKVKTPDQAEALVYNGLSLLESTLAKGDFTASKTIAEDAKKDAATAKNQQLVQRTTMLLTDLSDLEKEYTLATAQETETAAAGGDAAANQTLGLYHYFALKDQKKGVDYLKNAKDAPLKKAGGLEFLLGDTPSVESLKEAGDAWYDAAKTAQGVQKRRYQGAALSRYKAAYGNAPAPVRKSWDADKGFQNRMKELPATQPPGIPVNLLSLVDLQKDKIKGPWELRNNLLKSPNAEHQYVQIPFTPPDEYELTATVQLKGEPKQVYFGLVVGGDRQIHAIIEARPGVSSFLEMNGNRYEITNAKFLSDLLKKDRSCKLTCHVSKTNVRIMADDKQVVDYAIDYNMGIPGGLLSSPDPRAVTIGTSAPYEISKVYLTPTAGSGTGKKLR